MPARAKGKRYPIEITAVAWLDLLGYGSQLEKVGFDPSAREAHQAVQRLTRFQKLIAKRASRHIRALIINDGAALCRQLSPRTRSTTYDFIERSFTLFEEIQEVEKQDKQPSARMIIAVGPRLRISGSSAPNITHCESIKRRLDEGKIDATQAIHEACRSEALVSGAKELQANFAFSKAYLADCGGSKAGLGGSRCFIDDGIFTSGVPAWIESDKPVPWSSHGMTTTFYPILGMDFELGGAMMQAGVRTAEEVAKAIGVKY